MKHNMWKDIYFCAACIVGIYTATLSPCIEKVIGVIVVVGLFVLSEISALEDHINKADGSTSASDKPQPLNKSRLEV